MQLRDYRNTLNKIWHFVYLCNKYNKMPTKDLESDKTKIMNKYGITEICSFDKNNAALFYILGLQFKIYKKHYNTKNLGVSNLLTFKVIK